MSLEVACPSCHVVLSLPPDGEGSQLTCGGCGQLFAVAARRVESPARRPGGRLSQRKILLWAVVCPAVSFLVFVAVAAVVVHLRGSRHDPDAQRAREIEAYTAREKERLLKAMAYRVADMCDEMERSKWLESGPRDRSYKSQFPVFIERAEALVRERYKNSSLEEIEAAAAVMGIK